MQNLDEPTNGAVVADPPTDLDDTVWAVEVQSQLGVWETRSLTMTEEDADELVEELGEDAEGVAVGSSSIMAIEGLGELRRRSVALQALVDALQAMVGPQTRDLDLRPEALTDWAAARAELEGLVAETGLGPAPKKEDDRAKLIEAAVDFVNAKTYEPRGLHIYKADETGERYIVTDDAMVKLAHMLAAKTPDAYAKWCHVTSVIEVDVESVVLDSSIGEDTDLDALKAEAGAADDLATFMVLEFCRDEVEVEAARVTEDRREDEAG